jgi:DNA-binding response OmpR family regulator
MAKILVVDDDPDVCEILAIKLRRAGHEVLVAQDGEAGLATAQDSRPDAILLDWMMPRVSGDEMCSQIRQDPNIGSTPVIMMSVRATQTDIAHGLLSGADDYITKPFRLSHVVTRLERAAAEPHWVM